MSEPTNPKHYHGHPCVKCSSVLRFAASKRCVACNDENNLRNRFGVGRNFVDELWESQAGVCDICAEPLARRMGGYALDHNHATGQLRGLLCNPCNVGIGNFREEPKIFAAALAYLEQHRSADRRSAQA